MMDDYMFKKNVDACKYVFETTTYLEISTYSDPLLNTNEEHPLTTDEFENFLNRRGAFAPPKLAAGVVQTACIRLILQQNAQDPETFAPHVISLPKNVYRSMVTTMNLPFRGIESTSAVGPFFWCAYDQDELNPHLQIINRKSDVRKKGKTRGWEIMLSHSIKDGITTGYAKGTSSSDMIEVMEHFRACPLQIGHPLLLPIIIFSHDVSSKTDIKQREARDWLRKLEHAVSMRTEIQENEGYVKDGVVDLDAVNRDLVECHSQVLWKRPKAYMEIASGIEGALCLFWEKLGEERSREMDMRTLHRSLRNRMEFYKVKLQGIESYAYTTLQRLDIQRAALYNIIAQKESKLNFQMAGEQRKLAHASKRDSAAMKTISLLGAIFFPGAFIASLFSMTFFNFQSDNGGQELSPKFWIYWAVTIPLTVCIVGMWWIWERNRERKYGKEDTDLEAGSEDMERSIMATMRRKTMSKASTWGMQPGKKSE
ncbi:hypothetical protein BJ878DRAFT_497217 [Calycina marina]|uniref:Uncharacterized protein n=1 Tax=Calycina marina TaxID=1763456 RepID=A0A9P7Z6R2_9HELO|nr:hypothetical protein BJ878DRAFT_497217 [Calycina marina]